MKKQTLLEQAKNRHTTRHLRKPIKLNDENYELICAWLRDEVGIIDVSVVLGEKRHTNSYSRILMIVKQAYQKGYIKLK